MKKSSKHTIKECKALLRSCLSMLDQMKSSTQLLVWRGKCYKTVAHLLATSPESQLTESWLYDRIILLYNEITQTFNTL